MKGLSFDGACIALIVDGEMSHCLHFFIPTMVDNLFGNPVLFKDIEKNFLIANMTYIRTDIIKIKERCKIRCY